MRTFLDDVAQHGGFRGVCGLGFKFQTMENAQLRAALRLPAAPSSPHGSGVLVTRVGPLAPLAAALAPRDVLVAIDGVRIANDATVPLARGRERDRVPFEHLISSKVR